jgi:OmpR family two-component system sensor histidine kinase YxdK
MCAAVAAKPWYRFGRYALDHWRLLVGVVAGQVLAIVVVVLSSMSRGQPGAIGDGLYAGFLGVLGLVLGLFFDWYARAPGEAWLERLASTAVYPTEQSFDASSMPTRDLERALAALARLDRAWRAAFQRAEEQQRFTTTLALRAVHAVKTPVQTAMLLLEELGRHGVEEREQFDRALATLRQQLVRIDAIVMQVLAGMRLSEVSNDRRIQSVSLVELVREVINAFRADFVLRGIVPRLSVEGNPAEAVVPTDRKWARLVVEQIVRNGVQYARSSFTAVVAPDPDGCEIRFIDDGEGMTPEDLARATEPFYTGERGRKHREATGIGLYLAREAARELGIELRLRSAPGEGTWVTLRFRRSGYLDPLRQSRPESE